MASRKHRLSSAALALLCAGAGAGAGAGGCGAADDGAGWEEVEHDEGWAGADGKEDRGEPVGPLRVVEVGDAFVELANVGNAPVDLTGWHLSFGRRRVRLEAIEGRPAVIAPGALAVVADDAETLDTVGVPAWSAAARPSRPLRALLAGSRRIVVRDPTRALSDRADASTPSVEPGLSVERGPDGRFVVSELGRSPGERNGAAGGRPIATYFANPPFDVRDPLGPELARLLDGATRTVDAAFYQLSHPEVIDAFVRAAARGVRVRLVTDTRYGTDPDYAPGYARLREAGVTVVEDGRAARMHHKFVVVDEELVWTGSYNPVGERDAFVHADNAVLVRSRALAAAHVAEIDEMASGRFGARKGGSRHEVFVDGMRIEVYFAPTGRPLEAILRELGRARDSVTFCAFSFYQPEIGDAMLARIADGVDVRGVVDDTGATAPGSQYPRLLAAGADVRRPETRLWIHHKFLIVDYGTDDPVVITGSYNFSERAERENDEALYVIHDRRVAEAYYRIYRALYDGSAGANTDTTDLATLTFTEVASGENAAVELANYGDVAVPLAGLSLSDRDGGRISLEALGGAAPVPPGGRLRLSIGGEMALEPSDALVVHDARGRIVTTYDAPRYAGPGLVRRRVDPTEPDPQARWQNAPSAAVGPR